MHVILAVEDLAYVYPDGTPALAGISLALHAGERIAVVGANGSGKSTFFLNLNGVHAPTAGRILLGGAPVARHERNRLRAAVGLVFQDPDCQIVASTVRAEVSFGPMNLRLPKAEVVTRVENALRFMELEAFAGRAPHFLSGGEKKRVSIADLLAMESEVLMFDEPTASLDPAGTVMMESVLNRLQRPDRTLIVSTHDVDFAWRWASRVIVFDHGTVIADGDALSVFSSDAVVRKARLRKPVLLEVRNLLGTHGILPAHAPVPHDLEALHELLCLHTARHPDIQDMVTGKGVEQ